MAIGVSIIICCYNSSARLPETLKHIALQKVPDSISWEVIVVDNASTDQTSTVANTEWKKYDLKQVNFKVVNELTPGLTHARNRGVEESQYEYLLFCDDDNWLCDTYVSTAFTVMQKDATIGVLAGRSEAVSDISIPFWFSTFERAYAVGVLAIDSGDVTSRRHVWGAGMILRKSVYGKLAAAGFKHKMSDRSGNQLSAGGDTEICAWHVLIGFKLWYNEELSLKHFMTADRLTKEYFNKMMKGHLESSVVLKQYYHLMEAYQTPSFFSSGNRFKTSLKYYIKKILGIGTITFYQSSTMQLLFPNRSYEGFTKEVIAARDNYLKNHSA